MDKEKMKGSAENELDDMEIFRLLDEVIEHGEEALPEMEDYLTATADSVDSPEVDVEASLKKFKTEHAEFFVKPRRPHHWAYRVCVAASAVFVANTVCAFALGHSLFNYAAKWGAETFGFYRDDFATSNDGKIIYYPDGTWDDRSNMPEYDHETYTEIPQQDTMDEIDPTAPIGSENNPAPAEEIKPLPEFENLPDTDLSGMGLTKENSQWNDSHTVEYFNITHSSLAEVLEKFGIAFRMAPTIFPDGFSLDYITVTKDYLFDEMSFFANYVNGDQELAVSIRPYQNTNTRTVEKDDRAVIRYQAGDDEWYIMHNLENLSAISINDVYETLIYGNISVDEMKRSIDSIYM